MAVTASGVISSTGRSMTGMEMEVTGGCARNGRRVDLFTLLP